MEDMLNQARLRLTQRQSAFGTAAVLLSAAQRVIDRLNRAGIDHDQQHFV